MLQGVASVSVNWGAWAGSGMAAKAGVARMERMGFGAIEPGAGAAVLLARAPLTISCCASVCPRSSFQHHDQDFKASTPCCINCQLVRTVHAIHAQIVLVTCARQVLGAVLRSLGGPRAPAQLTGSVFLWDR